MKFQFVEKNRSSFPVKKMCHSLNVSQSGYYRWRKAPISPGKQENRKTQESHKRDLSTHTKAWLAAR